MRYRLCSSFVGMLLQYQSRGLCAMNKQNIDFLAKKNHRSDVAMEIDYEKKYKNLFPANERALRPETKKSFVVWTLTDYSIPVYQGNTSAPMY